MNVREKQLAERDVRREAPEVNPADFLSRYLASNFPQTAALPSAGQKEMPTMMMNTNQNTLNLNKKPLSGISYDNPGGV